MIARHDDLEVRYVTRLAELDAAQALRYRVFFEELGAVAEGAARRHRRDIDPLDEHADHLVVVDTRRSTGGILHVVGCYRLLRASVARRVGGFYSAAEFDLDGLARAGGEVLELGRSCVDAGYRNGAVVQLLWRGIADYLDRHGCTLMFGCASLPGTDVAAVARPIRYLHEHHLAPPGLRPKALEHRRVAHEPFAPDGYDARAAFRALPPLVKAYLRLGGMIGEGAVLDRTFNTIDVCMVLPTERIAARYLRHYARPAAVLAEAA